MKLVKNIAIWFLVFLLAIIALGTIPSFACIIAIVIALLIVPIGRWQDFLREYINGKIKTIGIIVLVVLMFATFPNSDTTTNSNVSNESSVPVAQGSNIESVNESSTQSVIESSAEVVDELTSQPAIEPSVEVTTESATQSKVESITEHSTESTTESKTEASKAEHIHKYKAATCTVPKTCSCGETIGNAKGHSWKDATCTSPKTCTLCNTTKGSAAGHSWKDATYTSPKTCTACGTTKGDPLDVPGKENYHGHVYTGGEYSKKYHYESDCAGKNSHEITWDEVERRGLGPCGTCVLK
jgi:hypothetical protein